MSDYVRIMAPEARLIWPHLFEPHAAPAKGGGQSKAEYSVEAILDPNSIGELKTKLIEVARAKWPNRELKNIKFPLTGGAAMREKAELRAERKGKDAPDLSYYDGKVVLRASSPKVRPEVFDRQGNRITDPAVVYGGCYGYVTISLKAYDGNGSNIPDSVKAYLEGVMKTRDGDRIGGGGRDAATLFAGVIGKQSQEDPTTGLDDEIPF